MWSNLVTQVSDIANQAATSATEVANQVSEQASKTAASAGEFANSVKESIEADIEKSKLVDKPEQNESGDADNKNNNNDTEKSPNELSTDVPSPENDTKIEDLPESVQNLTNQADQMADKIFNFASTWGGKALKATSEITEKTVATASKVNKIAYEASNQALEITTEKFQVIQDNEVVSAIAAQTKNVTKNVVDTVSDTIENKTIIGDFNKHQKEQINDNKNKNCPNSSSGAPWEGYEDWEILKTQILDLSKDKRTFVRNPPAGVTFNFDYQKSSKSAMAVLKEDENLNKMRFELVPKKLKEENFWKNYFYRVSLIKQSFNLKRLSSSKTSLNDDNKSLKSEGGTGAGEPQKQQSSTTKKFDELDKENDTHNENDNDMFISTELGNTEISADDLQAEMAALGMENGDEDWEKELNQELAEYEMVGEGNDESGDVGQETADWEKEVNEMLT